MEKLLIQLTVPSVKLEVDVFVPGDVEIATLAATMASGVQDMTNGRFGVSGREMLILADPELLLHPQSTLLDYGIQDGARLYLI